MRATQASGEVRRLEEAVSRMKKGQKENNVLIKQVINQILRFFKSPPLLVPNLIAYSITFQGDLYIFYICISSILFFFPFP